MQGCHDFYQQKSYICQEDLFHDNSNFLESSFSCFNVTIGLEVLRNKLQTCKYRHKTYYDTDIDFGSIVLKSNGL